MPPKLSRRQKQKMRAELQRTREFVDRVTAEALAEIDAFVAGAGQVLEGRITDGEIVIDDPPTPASSSRKRRK
jgi:hypothetical protein